MRNRGSEWSKWDLHVHTPASLIHHYPGHDPWPAFLDDLEALPPEVKVIGINDYLFLDGYKRVLEEKANGRLGNISLVLPVIELRIPQFGGTRSQWSRVNLHVIFDPVLSADQINDYFLASLVRHYRLSPEAEGQGLAWKSHPTREALEALGRSIIESVPVEERPKYGAPIIEGFNNLNITLESVEEALSHQMLKGRAITAVGKTEWADVKWQDGNIAEKKNTINRADFVFISCELPAEALRAREQLAKNRVNSRLLDCSDAHWLSTSEEKDRIGRCATWIKGDHTFRALRYARIEYVNRVYIGDKPPIFSRISKAPGKFIDRVRVRPNEACPAGKAWFDTELALNPEMVCLIGNKGSGKSALLDIIGLVGNSRSYYSFSFLRPERFRKKPQNPSRWFDAELHWRDGRVSSKKLSDDVDDSLAEEVRYLPQSYLEGICNEVSTDEEGRLDRELKRIIFECLPDEQRLGSESLESLIAELGSEFQGRLDALRSKISGVNREVIELEPLELPAAREKVQIGIASIRDRIRQHDASKPEAVPSPSEDDSIGEKLQQLGRELEECNGLARAAEDGVESAKRELGALERRSISLRRLRAKAFDVQRFVEGAVSEMVALAKEAELPIEIHRVLEVKLQIDLVDEQIEHLQVRREELARLIDPALEGSPAFTLATLRMKATEITSQMSEPMRLYVLYQQQLASWEKARLELLGSETAEGSLIWLEKQAERIASVGALLLELYDKRRELVAELASSLIALKESLRGLYGPAQKALGAAASADVPIEFNVELEARGFASRFIDSVHLGVRSGYQGYENATRVVDDLLGAVDFGSADSVAEFVEAVLHRLRWIDADRVSVPSVLKGGRSAEELYDFVSHLAFVSPVFRLIFDGKSISLLSPGQRGMVLLLFYLLIDPEDIPLLVDQPEENLDNQTVASYLTDAFRSARARRQVLVVTHNANLAVVCDADQIVVCNRDAEAFIYGARPLEELAAVENLLNVLEGTRHAFDLRGTKYAV